jgi:molybdenum cofactor cytidylyltransferase
MPAEPAGRIAGILLAAGSSVRMGRNKLLLTFKGESIVRRAARCALAVLDPVIVVLGHEAELVREELAGLPCRIIVNPKHTTGIHSSVQAGIAAVPAEADGAVVLLADMPLVTPAMITRLVETFRTSGAPLVISEYGDALAPPHLYGRALFPELVESGGCGKQVIRRHRARAAVMSWPTPALTDLDEPADRERVEALLGQES